MCSYETGVIKQSWNLRYVGKQRVDDNNNCRTLHYCTGPMQPLYNHDK